MKAAWMIRNRAGGYLHSRCNQSVTKCASAHEDGANMKKKIVIGSFLTLILFTVIIFVFTAINAYSYEVTGHDIMAGFGAGMLLMVGGFVVFYELDLFYTVYYFLIKPKTIAKSILHILSNITLVLIFFSDHLAYILYINFNVFKEDWLLPITLFLVYVAFRNVCAIIKVPADKRGKSKCSKSLEEQS